MLYLQEELEGGNTASLKIAQIESKTLGSLLFCRIAAHKIAVYLANMEEFCAGITIESPSDQSPSMLCSARSAIQ